VSRQHVSTGPFSHEDLQSQALERYAPLFEPITIGPKTTPNRFYAVPYTTGWSMHQIALERAHRRTRAEGGWGVVCTGQVLFDRAAEFSFLGMLELFDDDDARTVGSVAGAVHEFGALAGLELGHPGALSIPGTWRVPPRAPSQVQTDGMFLSNGVPQEMTLDDIAAVQDAWAAAARRGAEAGFDIVYMQCAHSSLAMQFLAPYYNRRTDEYGGSLERRARFLRETLERIREAIGPDTALACRFAIEGLGPQSVGIDEALETMRMVDSLVDLWDLSIGGFANAGADLTPSLLYPQGASLEWTRRAREATAKPVVGSARFTDPDRMLEAVLAGDIDLIGAARPGIADPFLPRKLASGTPGRIRPCIGSNRCAYSQGTGNLGCSQNATAGEEHRRGWHPERFERASNSDRSVLVVGAGPAGLECAIVLAERGFEQIRVVDAAAEPGGHVRWLSALPGMSEWNWVVEHRTQLIDELGIELALSARLDADAVFASGADIVVLATGSRWATTADSFFTNDPIPGADASAPHVLTPEQLLLEGKAVPGERVVLYDCQADHVPLSVVRHLQETGHTVELASPFADIGMRSVADGVSHALRAQIGMAGGRFRPAHFLVAVGEQGPIFLDETMSQTEVSADATVLMTQRRSDDGLYRELGLATGPAAGIEAVHRIGDCVAPQDLADAVLSGHRLAREIDAPTPAIPLPVRRA
jgi:dimethylamine/trimethylamine dehydrogenase